MLSGGFLTRPETLFREHLREVGEVMEEEERASLAALMRVQGFGPQTVLRLREKLGKVAPFLRAPYDELRRYGLQEKAAQALLTFRRQNPDYVPRLLETCRQKAIHMVAAGEPAYPAMLAEIADPPVVLFYRGQILADSFCLGIVGSRHFSRYGESVAKSLAERLAAAGITIVSGAARGIDSCAHRGALAAAEGRTAAVLGCGVDVAYPKENARLLQEILERGGLVLSEYAPGTPPYPSFFPARNRIISGLSQGIIVVEAARHSGSLITAEMALEQGRDVFAVPGSIYSSTSEGCHQLIRAGAVLVTSAQDVLSEYDIKVQEKKSEGKKKRPPMSEEELRIYQVLSFEHPLSIDEIIYSLKGGDVSRLTFLLLQMELRGIVIENESHGYLRAERE